MKNKSMEKATCKSYGMNELDCNLQPASQPTSWSVIPAIYLHPEKSTTQGRWGLGGAIGRQFLLQQIDSSGLQSEPGESCVCVERNGGGSCYGGVNVGVGVSESLLC